MSKKLNLFFATAMFLAVAGCHSIPIDEDTSSPVPEAEPNPGFNAGSGNAYDTLGGNNPNDPRGTWQDPAALDEDKNPAGADADGWVPVDPANRLGMPVIYFAYDSDVLVPSETANLDKIAAYLQKNPSLGLVIEGHCDSRGTDEYNRALGERRANAIRAYLAKKGVPDSSMKTMSFGKDKPAVSGSGESIWKQNRRGVPVPMQMPR
ncbi:MAG: OmpA family protein [Lentisphaeria bacterium]|nr:OmpA family protein [Lentisphaeria bacterium]